MKPIVLGRISLLLVGILCIGHFLGSEQDFHEWQTMPNPSDEAFADTEPINGFPSR
jgi:hypothetical protein